MHRQPDLASFTALARQYELVPVWRKLFSDNFTAVTACAALEDGGPTALFESVVGGTRVGRYSFLCVGPHRLIEARGRTVTWTDDDGVRTAEVDNPLDVVRQEVTARRAAPIEHISPFLGGAVGYAGYDVIRYVERLPNPPRDDRGLPDMVFGLFDQLLIFDNVTKTMSVVALVETRCRDGRPVDLERAYRDGCDRVDGIVDRLRTATTVPRCVDILSEEAPDAPEAALEANMTRAEFEAAVRRAVQYIYAGDIFQVVLSQRFEKTLTVDPFEVYRALRVVNPSPFMFYLRMPGVTLVGSSPEVMCRVMGDEVTVRPLAGTRRRGATHEEDERLAEELLADPKERAEHVMLVDLGRNDVGRVARFGSVALPEVMTVERYSHVMHISSTVTGELAPGKDAFDAMAAALPAGTVSGAPKVRAMEIIDELEPTRRGPYAGAVGYFDYRGNMDTCIALRTMVCRDDRAWVQAGAGIVADSDPAAEYQETLNKARGLLRAIDLAERAFADAEDQPAGREELEARG